MKGLKFIITFALTLWFACTFNHQAASQQLDLREVYQSLQDVEIAEIHPVGEFNNSEGLGGFELLVDAGKNVWMSTAITDEDTGEFSFENGTLTLKKPNGSHLQFDVIKFRNAHILVAPEQREQFTSVLESYDDTKVRAEFQSIYIYRFFSTRGFYIQVNNS